MRSRKSYGDTRVRKYHAEKYSGSAYISKSNNNTWELNIKYECKVLPWIILRMIAWLDIIIDHLHFINTLVNTTSRMHLKEFLYDKYLTKVNGSIHHKSK